MMSRFQLPMPFLIINDLDFTPNLLKCNAMCHVSGLTVIVREVHLGCIPHALHFLMQSRIARVPAPPIFPLRRICPFSTTPTSFKSTTNTSTLHVLVHIPNTEMIQRVPSIRPMEGSSRGRAGGMRLWRASEDVMLDN